MTEIYNPVVQEYEEFIYSHGAAQSGRTYGDFEEFIDFLNLIGNPPARLTFSASVTLNPRSSGQYNMANLFLRGTAPAQLGGPVVTLSDGFSISSWQNGGIETLGLINASNTVVWASSGIAFWTATLGSIVYCSGSAALISISGVGVIFARTSIFGVDIQTYEVFESTNASVFFVLNFADNAFDIYYDTIRGPGTIIVNVGSPAPQRQGNSDWELFRQHTESQANLTNPVNLSIQSHADYMAVYATAWTGVTLAYPTVQRAFDNLFPRVLQNETDITTIDGNITTIEGDIISLEAAVAALSDPYVDTTTTEILDQFTGANATFGSETASGTYNGSSSDRIHVSKVTMPAKGKLVSHKVNMRLDSAGTMDTAGTVYSDNAGDPDAPLAQSATVNISNTTGQFIEYTYSGVNQIEFEANDELWFGFRNSNETPQIQWGSTGSTTDGIRNSANVAFGDPLPNPFSAGYTNNAILEQTITYATVEKGVNVIKQMSITSDASGVKLVNDEASPGNSEYYGTNSSGTKGYHALPSGGAWTATRGAGTAITDTVTETSLLSSTVSLPAMPAGTAIDFTAAIEYLNNSGTNRNPTWRFKIGSTTILTLNQGNASASATPRFNVITGTIYAIADDSVRVSASGVWQAASGGFTTISMAGSGTGAEAIQTAGKAFDISVEHPAATSTQTAQLLSLSLNQVDP